MKQDIYTIRLRCKRYVQRYLIYNYGCRDREHPLMVEIRKDPQLREFINRAIKEPEARRDKWLSTFEGKKRNCEVEIRISADQFVRHGWHLTMTDETKLNSLLEARCKSNLLTFLTLQFVINENIETAIQMFYKKFGFSEKSWPSDSIRKIWSRRPVKNDIALKNEFNGIITKIFMDKLSIDLDNLHTTIA